MSAQIAPGWYDDPAGSGLQRWWSGLDWTEHTHIPAPPPPPPTSSPADNFGYTGAYRPMSSTPAQPPVASGTVPTRVGPASGNTFGVWMIATILFWAGFVYAPLSLLGQPVGSIAYLIVIVALEFIFAWRDVVALTARGIKAPSIGWMLLSPLGYLIARRIVLKRDGVRSNAPGNVFAIPFFLGLVGGLVAAALVSANPALFTTLAYSSSLTTLQTQSAAELGAQTNTTWAVTCPPSAPVTITGATFVCSASDTTGRSARIQAKVTTPGHFSISLLPAQNT